MLVYDDLFAVRVLNGRVVGLDEVVETELRDCDVSRRSLRFRFGVRTWMVSAVFPTPPSPNTTSLYRVIFPCDMFAGVLGNRGVRRVLFVWVCHCDVSG